MPTLVLTAPKLASADEESSALETITRSVSTELALPVDGVVISLVHTAAGSAGPVLIGYGRPRAVEAMASALTAARAAVALAWRTEPDRVWAQWVLTSS